MCSAGESHMNQPIHIHLEVFPMVDARGPTERSGSDAPARSGPAAAVPIALAGLAIIAVVAAVLLFLLWRDDDDTLTTTRQDTTVSAIAEDPQFFVGERVTVSGEVSEILTPFSYVIGGEQFVGGDELLVVGPPPAATTDEAQDRQVYPRDIVQITGEVREFDRAELEEEWQTEFPEDVFQDYEGDVVLVGESIGLTQRVQEAGADIVDTDEILEDPEGYYGERVSVTDEVTTVYSERVFVVGDGLIVIDETGVLAETALEEGLSVEAAGEVVQFDEADFGGADVTEHEGNPVMQAEFIQIFDSE